MSVSVPLQLAEAIVYPESDGQPMADNTKQFEYIVTIKGGLDALFRERDDVCVAGDLLWYPVEYDLQGGELSGWLRDGTRLTPIDEMQGWTSPRLGVRFELDRDELVLYRPDGRRFETYVELERQREAAEA